MSKYDRKYAEGEEIPVEERPLESLRRSIENKKDNIRHLQSRMRGSIKELAIYSEDQARTEREILSLKQAIDLLTPREA